MRDFLPYARQWLDEEDVQAVVDVLKSDYLTTGPKVEEFEEKLATVVGTKYAVAVSNGTAALHSACFAAGIGEGDEVITTPMTFVASANSILYCGGKPVFADIDPHTYNIDPADIRRKITGKTKAIIPVHFTGQPCAMEAIARIAEEYHLTVIEDAAHALGAKYQGRKVGSLGDMATFSFHPVKHITTGEGGAIATNDKILYQKLLMFRSHGITRDPEKLEKEEGAWFYEQQFVGYNYRMSDIQAALGIRQLQKLDLFIQKRKEIVERYNKAFKGLEELILPHQLQDTDSAWHLYIIQLRKERLKAGRKEIFEALRQRKIGVNVHYIPVYYHPYYRELGYRKGLCPHAEVLYEQMITLPLFPKMAQGDIEYVVRNVMDVVRLYSK